MMRQARVLALVLALCCVATLQADSLMLTSAPTGIIGPYVATINGTPGIEAICISFFNTTYLGTTYTNYTATPFSSFDLGSPLSGLSENNGTTFYQLAYLANQLFDVAPNTDLQKALQLAIWGIADSGFLSTSTYASYSSAVKALTTTLIDTATKMVYTEGQFDNFTIFTPTPFSGSQPQPFIVKTPEAPAIFMLLLTGAGIAAFTWRQRRRMLA